MDSPVTLALAFAAGFLSILSPCILPLLPIYLCYLSGVKIEDLTSERQRHLRIFMNSLAFTLGFTVVFVGLGGIAGLLGSLAGNLFTGLRIIGGAIAIFFGIYMLHLFEIPYIDTQRSLSIHFNKLNLATSVVLGMAFSVSWIPCTTPVLTTILVMGATTGSVSQSMILLIAYSLGLAVPFLFIGLFARGAFQYIEKKQKILKYYNLAAGALLIMIGILLLIGKLQWLIGQIAGSANTKLP